MVLEHLLDVVATNVTGLGAVQLALSLLPALEADTSVTVDQIYLPERGELADYRRRSAGPPPAATIRHLPNAVSRLVECTLGGRRFDRGHAVLVLGDVPLRLRARQILFVQTPHLLARLSTATAGDARKYVIMRRLFAANASKVAAFIVQSDVMRNALLAEYRIAPETVHVIQQPPPDWLRGTVRTPRPIGATTPLRLFYPAADYPHKNHAILGRVAAPAWDGLVERLVVTVPANTITSAPASVFSAGRLDPAAMRAAYAWCDALLFLSTAESYGFPLVEAISLGLPIVAADLPYARTLCGDEAFYFDPADPAALIAAVVRLQARLATGWQPNWTTQLTRLPRDWASVAADIAALVSDGSA